MSDHPEIPRVEFFDDGESMNVEEAVDRFRTLLDGMRQGGKTTLQIIVRACDCDSDIRGRDDYCPLHGDPGKLRERG